MGSFSITHWLILLVVVVVVFGTAKLKNAGKDLGSAVKGFKDAVKDENSEHAHKKQAVFNHDNQTNAVNAPSQLPTETPVHETKSHSTTTDDKA